MCEWVGAVAGIVGTVIGVVLTHHYSRGDAKRRTSAYWGALRIEVDRCATRARRFIDHDKPAPLGRFPRERYDRVIAELVAERAIEPKELDALELFYDHVDQVNMGLDQARAAEVAKDDTTLQRRHKRNRFKALRLINISRLDPDARDKYPDQALDTGETARAAEYYGPASNVIKSHGF